MDPFTHTLVGASLAASGLGRRSRYASAALVIGANLPDVDVFSYVAGGDAALCARRGWTHGVLALAILPLVLAAILLLWGRWGPSRGNPGPGPDVSAPWLVALSYLAVLTHPALDWLNTYGMRWLMPFSETWFYGDAVFIVDPWLWLVLGATWLLGRAPTPGRIGALIVIAVLLAAGVGSRAPSFVPLVVGIALVWLLALLVRPPDERRAARVASGGLLIAISYIALLLVLHAKAEATVREILKDRFGAPPLDLMVGPVPADPWSWDVVAIDGDELRWGSYSWRRGSGLTRGRLEMVDTPVPRADSQPVWREIVTSGQEQGFLGWARFPWLIQENGAEGRLVYVMDARYARSRTTGFGGARFVLPPIPEDDS
jgi:inner membrane protein